MKITQEYLNSIHRFGRASVVGAIIVMMGIPIIMSFYTGLFPGVGTILKASIDLLAIFVPITEVLSYTPVLGSSIYLTLITGNVMNALTLWCIFIKLDQSTSWWRHHC